MKIEIEVEHAIGDPVEYKDKRGLDSGFCSGYVIREGNRLLYMVTWSDKKESEHYGFELKKPNR